jgi:Tfp pilus assembly protein PilF
MDSKGIKRAVVWAALGLIGAACLLAAPPAGAEGKAGPPDRAAARRWVDQGLKAPDAHQKITYYRRAVEADPTYAVAWNNLAVAWGRLGNWPQAVIDYGRAIRLQPRYAMAYANRGFTFRQMRLFRLAAADYGRAIRIQPRNWTFLRDRAQVYSAWGKYQPAVKDLTRALALAPRVVQLYRMRASAYRSLGQQDLARGDEERVREMTHVRTVKPVKPKPAPGKAVFRFETQEASVKRGSDYPRQFAIYVDDKRAGATPWRKRTELKTVSLPLTPGTHHVMVREMTRQSGPDRAARTPFNKRYLDQKFTIVVQPNQEVTMRIMLFRNGEVVNPPKIMVNKLRTGPK